MPELAPYALETGPTTQEMDLEKADEPPALRLMTKRASGRGALLSAACIKDGQAWRWQIRSDPPMAGTDRAHPGDSLQAFLDTHGHKLLQASRLQILEHIALLHQHDAAAFRGKRKAQAKPDLKRYDPPSLPPPVAAAQSPG